MYYFDFEIRDFKATNGNTYKGLFTGKHAKVKPWFSLDYYPIPFFDQNTIDKYLSQFNKEDLNYLLESQILGIFCPKSQRYILGDLELPKVDFEGKTYFCFALDMQFQLIKINE